MEIEKNIKFFKKKFIEEKSHNNQI